MFEPYAVAYDANSKRLGVAAQDNGVSLQSAPGSLIFNAINFGDGTNIVINDRTLHGTERDLFDGRRISALSAA